MESEQEYATHQGGSDGVHIRQSVMFEVRRVDCDDAGNKDTPPEKDRFLVRISSPHLLDVNDIRNDHQGLGQDIRHEAGFSEPKLDDNPHQGDDRRDDEAPDLKRRELRDNVLFKVHIEG